MSYHQILVLIFFKKNYALLRKFCIKNRKSIIQEIANKKKRTDAVMSVTASPLLFRNLSRSDEGRPPSLGPAPPESSMSSEEAPEEEQTERLLRGRNPEMAGPRADVGRRERSFGGRGRLAAAAAAEERASSMSTISSSVTISIGIAGGGGFERWSPPAPPINCLRFNRRAKRLFVSIFVHEWF